MNAARTWRGRILIVWLSSGFSRPNQGMESMPFCNNLPRQRTVFYSQLYTKISKFFSFIGDRPMEKSRTKRALEMLENNPGMSIYRAAKAIGVSAQVVGQALKAIKRKEERQKFRNEGGYFESD